MASEPNVAVEKHEPAPSAWEGAAPRAGHAERTAGGGSWLGRSPVASADLWPSATRGPEGAPGAGELSSSDSAGAESQPGTGPEPVGDVDWPSSPWTGWAMPDSVETQEPQVADRDIPPVEIKAADEAVESEQSAGTADGVEPSTLPASPAGAVGTFGEATPTTGDALGRALGLVDELRGLLPALAGASGVDLTAAIAALRAARDEAATLDGEALTRVEDAVAAARERPGDVHALLALSGSLDTLAEVLRHHGRYAVALDQAIGYLAGGDGGASGSGTAVAESEPDEPSGER